MTVDSLVGNFALILFILLIISGAVWVYDRFYLRKKRRAAARAALAEFDVRNEKLAADGMAAQTGRRELEMRILKQPLWIEYTGSFFPTLLLVFLVRSFLYEPFKIPSTSMLPTLEIGDLILVNKFTYGIRLPIIDKKIIDISEPKRGDVMVFTYPKDTTLKYIKRVVGVAGDKVVYRDKRLTINGEALSYADKPDYLEDNGKMDYWPQYEEQLNGVKHRILVNPQLPPVLLNGVQDFANRNNCTYSDSGFSCTVPDGYYFMMGDNRDNSEDSRYWGFVPEKYVVGKAFLIWMNFSHPGRTGTFFK